MGICIFSLGDRQHYIQCGKPATIKLSVRDQVEAEYCAEHGKLIADFVEIGCLKQPISPRAKYKIRMEFNGGTTDTKQD